MPPSFSRTTFVDEWLSVVMTAVATTLWRRVAFELQSGLAAEHSHEKDGPPLDGLNRRSGPHYQDA